MAVEKRLELTLFLLRSGALLALVILFQMEHRRAELWRDGFYSLDKSFHRIEAVATNAQWIAAEAIRQRDECWQARKWQVDLH